MTAVTTKRPPRPRKATAARRPAKRAPANGAAPAPPNGFVAENAPAAYPEQHVLPDFEPGAPPPQSAESLGLKPRTPDPEEFVPTTAPVPPPPEPGRPNLDTSVPVAPHPYGDRAVYVYTPKPGSKAGDAPIVFPHMSTVRPTVHFMWKLRKLNQQPVVNQLDQAFEWMDVAQVPDAIQERVTLLPEQEQGDFFVGWFAAVISPENMPPEVLPGE